MDSISSSVPENSNLLDAPSLSKKLKMDPLSNVGVDYTLVTDIKVRKFCYKWTINNYSFCYYKTGQSLKSPKFLIEANSKYQWLLCLYPKGQTERYEEYISLYLQLVSQDSKVKPIEVEYKFCIINCNGEKKNERVLKCVFNKSTGRGLPSFIKIDDIINKNNGLLPDDSLTILCEMCMSANDNNYSNYISTEELDSSNNKLSSDIQHFLENVELSDITLTASEMKFHAHKLILAARSQVLSNKINQVQEKKEDAINFDDVKPEVLKEMLRYIYTNRVENLQTLGKEILLAANKYGLEGLKAICEKAVSNFLNIDNVIDNLIFAHHNKTEYLKNRSIFFIAMHIKDIIDTPQLKSLEKSYPELALKIYHMIISK